MRRYKTTQCQTCSTDILATSRGKYCKPCAHIHRVERNRKRFRANFARGLCRCGKPRVTTAFCAICWANRKRNASKRRPAKRLRDVARRREVKMEVFAFYGDACACCGDTTFEFLSVDHVGGWGKNHLNPQGNRYGGNALYVWIVKNGFPEGFRLLCGSCHYAVSYHGYCPHGKLDAAMLQSNEASIIDVIM